MLQKKSSINRKPQLPGKPSRTKRRIGNKSDLKSRVIYHGNRARNLIERMEYSIKEHTGNLSAGVQFMNNKIEQIASATGKDSALADKLEQILSGPNDRAFLVCTYLDCTHNAKGECTIFTVMDVPRMKPAAPCDNYNANSPGGGEKGDETGG